MDIYFAWAEKEEIFSPLEHDRHDIPIFYLSIQQKENGFAFATIRTPFLQLPHNKQAFISYKNAQDKIVLLFKGYLWNIPTRFCGQMLQFELTTQPEKTWESLEKIQKELEKTPHWDPLFVPPFKRKNPSQHLENRSALYSWSRTTHEVCLSDIFQGKYFKNIGKNIWDETLTISCYKPPLSQVTVHLEANWTQQHWGVIDVGGFLKNRLDFGMISSFTGNDLQQRWPTLGKSFNKSGYTIIHSRLKEIDFSTNRSLQRYPVISPVLKEKHGTDLKDVCFKRFWFKPELIVAWQYRQHRKETMKITLKNSVQDIQKNSKKNHTIFLKLGNLCADRAVYPWKENHSYALFDLVEYQSQIYRCQQSGTMQPPPAAQWTLEEQPVGLKNPAHSTFFLTDRGYQTVAHAVDIARAHLAASSRSIKITFKTNWDVLDTVCLDHTLTIEDPRLPEGKATGKVTEYQFVAEGQKNWIYVVLLCSVGNLVPPTIVPENSISSYSEGYLEPENTPISPCGISFPRFDHLGPEQGLLNPWTLKIYDLITHTLIENTAEQQLEMLKTLVEPTSIAKELKKIPTKIRLPLKPLATQHCLEHTIVLDIPEPWTPPCQILLKRK